MKYFLEVGADGAGTHEAEIDGGVVRLDGREFEAHLTASGGGARFYLQVGGRGVVGFAHRMGDAWEVQIEGRYVRVRVEDERKHHIRSLVAEAGGASPPELRAPMPGLIVRVDVEAGETVTANQALVVMEAMKMENELRAEADGVVASVAVEAGDTVDRDDLLLTFE